MTILSIFNTSSLWRIIYVLVPIKGYVNWTNYIVEKMSRCLLWCYSRLTFMKIIFSWTVLESIDIQISNRHWKICIVCCIMTNFSRLHNLLYQAEGSRISLIFSSFRGHFNTSEMYNTKHKTLSGNKKKEKPAGLINLNKTQWNITFHEEKIFLKNLKYKTK